MENLETIKGEISGLRDSFGIKDLFAKESNLNNQIISLNKLVQQKYRQIQKLESSIKTHFTELQLKAEGLNKDLTAIQKHKGKLRLMWIAFRFSNSDERTMLKNPEYQSLKSVLSDLMTQKDRNGYKYDELNGMIKNDEMTISILRQEIPDLKERIKELKAQLVFIESDISIFNRSVSKIYNQLEFVNSQFLSETPDVFIFFTTYAHITYRIRKGIRTLKIRNYLRKLDRKTNIPTWFKVREGKDVSKVSIERAKALEKLFTISK